jgi:ATP-dependent Zn protease
MKRRTKALESTAYHEAGHAVAAYAHGVRTKALSIVPDGDSKGRHEQHPYFGGINLEFDSSPRAQRRVENMVLVCLAGPAAQRRFNTKGFRRYHADHDWRQAIDLLSYLVGSNKELEAYLRLIDIRARAFVETAPRWIQINRLAQNLLDRQTLTGPEVRQLMAMPLSDPGKIPRIRTC